MGGKRVGFSSYEQSTVKKQAKQEISLAEMVVVVPWQTLTALIEPPYRTADSIYATGFPFGAVTMS